MSGPSKDRSPSILFAVLVLLAIAAIISERLASVRDLRRLTQARAVEGSALGSGDTREIMQHIRALHLVPGSVSPTGSEDSLPSRSQYLSLDPLPQDHLSDALGIGTKWLAREVPVVALLLDPREFEELHANPFGRGRKWERAAFLAFLDRGELQLTTKVGLRIHGNWSRSTRDQRSYRLHFRGLYGLGRFPTGLFRTGGSHPPRVVVLNWDHGPKPIKGVLPFTTPLAIEIASRVGALTPRAMPIVLFVNGELLGVFHLTERIDEDYLLSHFGHDDFVVTRTQALALVGEGPDSVRPVPINERVKVGSIEVYQEFRNWAENSAELDYDTIDARVDIENLSRWLLANLICSNQDLFQGSVLFDLRKQDQGWFWTLWDLDTSFNRSTRRPVTLDWILTEPDTGYHGDERRWLLRRLIGIAEYREYLAALFIETMNHRTDRGFIHRTTRRYRDRADTFAASSDHFDRIPPFLARQRHRIEKEFQEILLQGPVHTVTVEGPAEIRLLIDGYPSAPGYVGRYFRNMPIDLEVPEAFRENFSHWRVRGRKISSHSLRLPVDDNLRIVAKLKRPLRRKGP